MKKRVVITGLGVVAPNGVGIPAFSEAIKKGISGIKFFPELRDLNFSCQLGAMPIISEEKKREYLSDLQLRNFNSSGILYGVIAGMDALKDAKIEVAKPEDEPLWDLGIIFGTGTSGIEKFREAIYRIDDKNVRRLGSTSVAQTMTSGVSAYLGGLIGAGNMVTANSSACATGTEALLMGYEHIVNGKAKYMLCGSTSDSGPYIWGGFDAMKVTTYKYNDSPGEVAGPMSAEASGFVPGSGAGAYLLESLESAQERGATIYAEILGGAVNNGGQRGGGSMSAPNSKAIQKCITDALKNSDVTGEEIDYINGHLTATIKDPDEIENWSIALNRNGDEFPYINSLKGMVGHCLAACGSIEIVSAILQLHEGFIFPNVNCENLHPEISYLIASEKIPTKFQKKSLQIIAKASFGFGDVNACAIFKKN
ncbi:beta-ketoacyl-[acyl-carrier-protein] synthase family protein [Aequorivita lipolytica]|uniref:3-oxoacyl-[acyl-carrier-protein] synthase 1 n=1 Tax=Aequorivita lipolytica TaxID=153267 RepID=A0A5C6YLL3_9FLAO|nr:beta-ketoacyl-[acyl-carrier-protein] synthase family protein [Aequorivita lipolytica]TXD68451.1 beta-ketoacyl-[acyl-carrier-protein] synthase family protein [Aequorivita lipolytica]SRX51402.1 3-oxoacyl-[acyl-carrier-protein] synthase 1 [Aequorivita lipolytica]